MRRGSPPPRPIRQPPCPPTPPKLPCFYFPLPPADPLCCWISWRPHGLPSPRTHTRACAHPSHAPLSLPSLPTSPDALVAQLAATCSSSPLKPLHPHPVLTGTYPLPKPLRLPSGSGDDVEPAPCRGAGLSPVAPCQLGAVGVLVSTHPPIGRSFPLRGTIRPFPLRVVPPGAAEASGGLCQGWLAGQRPLALVGCRAAGGVEGPRSSVQLWCTGGPCRDGRFGAGAGWAVP